MSICREYYKHVVVLGGTYCEGKRIALHYVVRSNEDLEMVEKEMQEIKRKAGTLQNISTRMIITDSDTWNSVTDKEKYFSDVELCESCTEFIKLITKDLVLSSVDVANYIISKFKRGISYLALHKLSYLCHAEFLCKFETPLFRDMIYAFDRGPVCSDIYRKYHETNTFQYNVIYPDDKSEIYESRLLSSFRAVEKIKVIDDIIARYGNCSADELVDITHRENSPWSKVYRKGIKFNPISENIIRKYHYIENV